MKSERPHRPPILRLHNITIRYGKHIAVQQAALQVASGELMALVGPSGCGKSSLLSSINRISDLIPNCSVEGDIFLDQENIRARHIPSHEIRSRIGMVFQQPNPFPLSIAENILFPLREHGLRNKQQLNERLEQVLRAVGLWEEVHRRLDQRATELSGGQQQRLCIARALALEPEVLLFDEPCSALDPIATQVIEDLIATLKGKYTILMVTHNLAQARRLADSVTVCWVNQGCGCVVETGSNRMIFETPSNPITQAYCQGKIG
jgi:phosphate transport system ATP-binding protein